VTHHDHIPGSQCQDASCLEGSLAALSPALKSIESIWDVLEETLSARLLQTRSWPKNDAPFDGNNWFLEILSIMVRRTVAKHTTC